MRLLNIFLAISAAIFFAACGGDTNVSTGGGGAVAVQGGDNEQTITIKEDDTIAQGTESSDASANAGGTNNASDNFINLDSNALKSILFAFDRYDVSPNDPNINAAAQLLSDTGAKVVLEGNTDSFGSDEYNYALGKKRADAVKRVLVQKGIDAANIATITYGESKPVCLQETPQCYQANRRVDFKIAQ